MSINAHDLRRFAITPALDHLSAHSGIAVTDYAGDLLMATAAQETALGTFLHQSGNGDALSIVQFEPSTLHDLMDAFVLPSPRFSAAVRPLLYTGVAIEQQIVTDLFLSMVLCRLNYYRVRSPLPTETTLDTLWSYYKPHWNTAAGAATELSFARSLKLTDIVL